MKPLLLLQRTVLASLLLVVGQTWAQAPGRHAGYGAGYHARQTAASAPRGPSLLTPQERDAHRAALAATPNQAECRLVRSRQREQASALAQERGLPLPTPRRDPCAAKQP
jgi:hypothetical protein